MFLKYKIEIRILYIMKIFNELKTICFKINLVDISILWVLQVLIQF